MPRYAKDFKGNFPLFVGGTAATNDALSQCLAVRIAMDGLLGLPLMTSALEGEGSSGKEGEVREASKGRFVKKLTKGDGVKKKQKFCGRH